jgi:flagellar motor switch protein FliN/FliY
MTEAVGEVTAFPGRSASLSPEANAPPQNPLALIEKHPQWLVLARLPLKLIVSVPIASFKVKDLLALAPGQMIRSSWKTSDDAPIVVASVTLAVCEFEVVEQRLAVRLTRLVSP